MDFPHVVLGGNSLRMLIVYPEAWGWLNLESHQGGAGRHGVGSCFAASQTIHFRFNRFAENTGCCVRVEGIFCRSRGRPNSAGMSLALTILTWSGFSEGSKG